MFLEEKPRPVALVVVLVLGAYLAAAGQAESGRPSPKPEARPPGDPAREGALAESLLRQKMPLEAEEAARRAIKLDPQNVRAYECLGRALARQDKPHAALQAYRTALSLDPQRARTHFYLGSALHLQHRTQEARQAFRKALELDPGFYRAHFQLAETYAEVLEREKAIVEYRRAITINPRYTRAHYELSVLLRCQGKFEESLASLRTVLELEPDRRGVYEAIIEILTEKRGVRLSGALAAEIEKNITAQSSLIELKALIITLAYDSPAQDLTKAARYLRQYVKAAEAKVYPTPKKQVVPASVCGQTLVAYPPAADTPADYGNCFSVSPVPVEELKKLVLEYQRVTAVLHQRYVAKKPVEPELKKRPDAIQERISELRKKSLSVVNMHAENFKGVVKKHGLKTVEVELVSDRFCFVVDPRIPRAWHRTDPCSCVPEHIRIFCTTLPWIPPQLTNLVPLKYADRFQESERPTWGQTRDRAQLLGAGTDTPDHGLRSQPKAYAIALRRRSPSSTGCG